MTTGSLTEGVNRLNLRNYDKTDDMFDSITSHKSSLNLHNAISVIFFELLQLYQYPLLGRYCALYPDINVIQCSIIALKISMEHAFPTMIQNSKSFKQVYLCNVYTKHHICKLMQQSFVPACCVLNVSGIT